MRKTSFAIKTVQMMIRYLTVPAFVVASLMLPVLVYSQTGDRTVPQQIGDDIRFPALPYYSYGSGLGLTTPDSTFRLNIRFRMQNRATFTDSDVSDPAIDAVVRRLRLRFDGFVGDPRFLYAIQLSFAPGDVGELQPGENINIIRDAVIFYQPNDTWSIGFGQTKLPGNRQRINSSGALQLTDRSINNARFTIDRDFGLHLYYIRENINRTSFNIKTAVSTGNGRNWTHDPDTRLAYTGKFEFFPLGAFQRNGTLFEGDLVREQTPKVMFSSVYHFNAGAQRTQGETGNVLFEQRDLTSVLLDAMMKYRGLAIQLAWMTRRTDDPVTVKPENPDDTRFVFTGEGYDAQVSYIFPRNIEIIGRYSVQNPADSIRELVPDSHQYSFGITKYIWEHALKLQSEITKNRQEYPDGGVANGWYLRFQVEIGI
jgi:phosphate-selective porin OprO and OprP